MAKRYEYQRTCSRCSTSWYVPVEIAEAKPGKQAKAAGWFTPVVGAKRQALNAARAMVEQTNAAIASSGQCPSCGSSAYTQAKLQIP